MVLVVEFLCCVGGKVRSADFMEKVGLLDILSTDVLLKIGRRDWLVGLVAQILKFRDEKAKEDAEIEEGKKKKKKLEDPADAAIPVEDRETSVKLAEIKLLNMEKLAKEAADQGVVPFYGCSRCRYSRGGCVSYKCPPDKFNKHVKQFPEKYEGKVLKVLVEDKELIGGGGGKVHKVK